MKLQVLFAAIACLLMGFAIQAATGMNPFIGAAAAGVISTQVSAPAGAALAGLNKELWLTDLLEGFYADDMFISECWDMSAFVENDIINLAEAGVNPDVLINNTTYPINTSERPDGAIALELDRFDTENTSLKHADRVEAAYDKMTSIIYGHKQALRMTFMEKGAHAIAPTADSADTPVIQTTGGDNGSGKKRLLYADVLRLKRKFDDAEIPEDGRILVLSAQHQEDLELEDAARFKTIMSNKQLAGFKLYFLASKRLPAYVLATSQKAAFGSAFVEATHSRASIAFHNREEMRAKGDPKMFHGKAEDDPQHRQDVIGFAHRGLVLPLRNKGVASIFSPAI
jgi:hypothetical protein